MFPTIIHQRATFNAKNTQPDRPAYQQNNSDSHQVHTRLFTQTFWLSHAIFSLHSTKNSHTQRPAGPTKWETTTTYHSHSHYPFPSSHYHFTLHPLSLYAFRWREREHVRIGTSMRLMWIGYEIMLRYVFFSSVGRTLQLHSSIFPVCNFHWPWHFIILAIIFCWIISPSPFMFPFYFFLIRPPNSQCFLFLPCGPIAQLSVSPFSSYFVVFIHQSTKFTV